MKIKSGSPKSTVTIWTQDNVYELHSDAGNPDSESDVISITVTKTLSSIAGSWSISLVPRPDAAGSLWSEKLSVFDYVEIKMKGGNDDQESVVCRGLIDQIGVSESFGGGIPQRAIQISGRDLGALLVDFSILYLIGYEPYANLLKVFSWKSMPKYEIVNAQEAFDIIMGRWKELVELTVGNIEVDPDTGVSSGINIPRSLNLASKISYFASSFFPDMKTVWGHLASYEGTVFNALEVYRDKPFHELLMYEDDFHSRFIMRPSNLKDMKGNFPLEVNNLKKSLLASEKGLYQSDIVINPEDIIQQRYQVGNSQMYNYFFTTPKLSPLYGSDFLSVCCLLTPERPWDSINPFISIKDQNDPNAPEPLGFIGRYGIRKMEVSSNFTSMSMASLGQIEMRNSKEAGGNPDQKDQESSKKASEDYVKPSTKNKRGLAKIPAALTKYDALVQKAANDNGFPPAVIYALMTAENSEGDPNKPTACKNGSTSWGLMQINDYWHRDDYPYEDGVQKWTDPKTNIEHGAALLKQYYNDSGWTNAPPADKLHCAVDAYYAGLPKVRDAVNSGNFPSYPDPPPGWRADELTQTTIRSHWNNFARAYDLYSEALANAAEAKAQEQAKQDANNAKTGQTATQVTEVPNGSIPIRDDIKEEASWFGLRLNQVLVTWYLHNHLLRSGTLTIRGTNQALIGTYAKVAEENSYPATLDYEYYIEGVTHNFTLFQGYTTELTLSRGQPTKESGGLYELGYKGKFYFDTTRTVDEVTREKYQKLSAESKNARQTDSRNVPLTPEQAKQKIHPES
jgi:hypothetical protein